ELPRLALLESRVGRVPVVGLGLRLTRGRLGWRRAVRTRSEREGHERGDPARATGVNLVLRGHVDLPGAAAAARGRDVALLHYMAPVRPRGVPHPRTRARENASRSPSGPSEVMDEQHEIDPRIGFDRVRDVRGEHDGVPRIEAEA